MERVAEVLARVAQLSSGQWGLLTAGQAEREGVPRYRLARLAEQGLLERLEHGVYAVSASQADEHRRLRAAWLALAPTRTAEERLGDLIGSGVVSHTSAANLYGLGDLLHDIPELTLTTRRQTRRGVRLHRAELTAADVTVVDGLPATTVERTVADLLRDGTDLDQVANIVGDGVRRGLVDRDRLSAYLQPLAHRYGDHDGVELCEHLLDLQGLSSQALERQLVNSPVGQQLLNAGALAAITRLADALPTPDTSALKDDLAPRLNAIIGAFTAASEPSWPQYAATLARLQQLTASVAPWMEPLDHPTDELGGVESSAREASA